MPDTRPVWLTREQRDSLVHGACALTDGYTTEEQERDSELLAAVVAAWDAAPADAIAVGVEVADNTGYMSEDFVPAIARAWGMPDA